MNFSISVETKNLFSMFRKLFEGAIYFIYHIKLVDFKILFWIEQ